MTPGVAVEPTVWIPVESAEVMPVIKTVEDTSGYGIIDKIADVMPTENTSETSISGIIRSDSIGHLLLATLGEVSAPTQVVAGVHRHEFTRLNSNCPITHTITEDTPAGAKQAPYSAIDSIDIEGKVGDYVRFTIKYIGGQIVQTTDKNPAYVQEKPFISAGMSVKMADDVAGLASAQNVRAQSFKITINKNLESFMALGSMNVDSIHNTTLEVKGDMELVYDSDAMMTQVVEGKKKALQAVVQSIDNIGSTDKKAEFGVVLPRVALSEWKKSNDMDKIVTQTIGFTGTFSVEEAKTLSMWLVNSISTKY